MSIAEPSIRVERTARVLRIDDWTVTVVQALRRGGVRSLLLKGPAVSEWLYGGDRTLRPYNDADLLVAPDALSRTRATLRELGFACDQSFEDAAVSGNGSRHAELWFRAADSAAIDLHLTLHGLDHLDPQTVWEALSRDTDRIVVLDSVVEVPSAVVRTLHVVLHMQPDQYEHGQAWTDLERAVAVVPRGAWVRARALAEELGVLDEMGCRLRLVPSGRALADELALPADPPPYFALFWDKTTPPVGVFVAQLRQASPTMAARLVVRKLLPSPAYIRLGRPVACRSRVWLVRVYLWRLTRIPVRVGELLRCEIRRRARAGSRCTRG